MAATDTTAQAAKLRALQPDAIFVIGTTATPFRAIRQLQMKQPIIAVNGASSYEALNAMGTAVANDIIFPEFIVNEDPLPNQKEFVELFRREMNGGRRTSRRRPGTRCTSRCARSTRWAPMPVARSCARRCASAIPAMANYDFAADDMTGIGLSSFVFSKLVNGQYTRTPFRINK